jgi:uncharacterized protein (TIGR03086 family)
MTNIDSTHEAPTTEAIVRDYRRSLEVMAQAVRTADPNRWDSESPCAEWTARQVVGHAITFVANVVALADDGPAPDFHAEVDFAAVAGVDPAASWAEAQELIEHELLVRPGRLSTVRMTPLGVEMPMAQLLTFQGMDPVVHGWDVATATGGRVHIPADLALAYRARFAPVAADVRAAGLLGAETASGADDPVEVLLDFCGRIRG